VNTLYHLRPARSIVAVALALLVAGTALGTPMPARADGQQSTQTLILSGLAAAAAIILYNNYHHKQVAANSVVGYTRDGGVVHGDGRITYPNGTVLYTGNSSGQRCSYMGYGTSCGQRAYAYRGHYANDRDDNGRHNKHRHPGNGDNNDNDNGNNNNGDDGGDG
jgi:hypothetical protein